MSATASAFPKGQVIYQIYPRSFKDSNGDGIGDLGGVIEKLDYVADLGATAIWLNPIQKSPMADFGYDISDYYQIDPLFGTLEQYEALLELAHQKKLQIIMDLAMNHTSDQHDWFLESRSSKDNPKRDWYIWKDPQADGTPPNNWLSEFGGSAWEHDATTGQYYLHSFLKQQPDLNWQNPEVREAIKSVLKFWLDKGVDGFRLDAVYWYSKDPDFRNDPINLEYKPGVDTPYDELKHIYSKRGLELYNYLNELVEVVKKYDNRFLLTELSPHHYTHTVGDYLNIYQQSNPAILAPLNFILLPLPWQADRFQSKIDSFQAGLEPEDNPVYLLGNHDQRRLASRIGLQATAAAAVLLLTLPGTVVIYYGDELGMENAKIAKEQLHDEWELNVPHLGKGRDPERTPMQWSPNTFSDFSTSTPWLPLAASYKLRNVSTESADPNSLLNLNKKLLSLKKASAVLLNGTYTPLKLDHPQLFGFMRSFEGKSMATIVNFSDSASLSYTLEGSVILSTQPSNTQSTILLPNEARLIEQ